MDAVAGYCIANDVSERAFQMEHGQTICKGKGAETFGPLGPWFVSKDEIKQPQKLAMWTNVNGAKRQRGSTATMVFDVAHLVWYLSQIFVLEPGDVIATGTPPGVAFGMKPPVYLKAGDVVEMGIDGLGVQRQKVVGFRADGRSDTRMDALTEEECGGSCRSENDARPRLRHFSASATHLSTDRPFSLLS